MRVNIQRVTEAAVKINEVTIGEIKKGILVLIGIENEDNLEDIKWLTQKN
jgi:D-tyrosyl-tRNA(Tyr) deacylase